MKRERDSSLLGSFEEQVMLAVVRTGDDAYGMNVRRELERVTERNISIGSVYATLDRLESKGMLTSVRPDSSADASSRRLFVPTAIGTRSLALTRTLRERLWAGVKLQPLPDL